MFPTDQLGKPLPTIRSDCTHSIIHLRKHIPHPSLSPPPIPTRPPREWISLVLAQTVSPFAHRPIIKVTGKSLIRWPHAVRYPRTLLPSTCRMGPVQSRSRVRLSAWAATTPPRVQWRYYPLCSQRSDENGHARALRKLARSAAEKSPANQ